MTTDEAWIARQRLVDGEEPEALAASLGLPAGNLTGAIARTLKIPRFVLFASLGGRSCGYEEIAAERGDA